MTLYDVVVNITKGLRSTQQCTKEHPIEAKWEAGEFAVRFVAAHPAHENLTAFDYIAFFVGGGESTMEIMG